jgi:hypothetical protein
MQTLIQRVMRSNKKSPQRPATLAMRPRSAAAEDAAQLLEPLKLEGAHRGAGAVSF